MRGGNRFSQKKAEFWPVMPPEQTPDRVRERILEFGRAHRA